MASPCLLILESPAAVVVLFFVFALAKKFFFRLRVRRTRNTAQMFVLIAHSTFRIRWCFSLSKCNALHVTVSKEENIIGI